MESNNRNCSLTDFDCSNCKRSMKRDVNAYTVCFCSVYARLVVRKKAENCPLFMENWRRIGHFT